VGRGRPLYLDRSDKDRLEARNGILQYRLVRRLAIQSRGVLNITPEIIKSLHREAIKGIYSCAGRYRTWGVKLGLSHKPPESRFVPGLVEQMCSTANETSEWDPVQVAAYLLWRVNWIHPFGGGNGRTSRALAELSLRVRLNHKLPGKTTLTEQIDDDREEYIGALKDADAAWSVDVLNVSQMELLLGRLLEERLERFE
jgi:Fic family protein